VHVGSRPAALTRVDLAAFGELDAYTTVDFAVGFKKNTWSLDFFLKNAFDEDGQLTRFAQCATEVCGGQTYTVHTPPRSIGVRFSQEF
jgi:iron complex outermembrane recepter protein